MTFEQHLALNTGASMPVLGFGTWQLRGEDCRRAVVRALDVGYRMLDTAAVYGNEEQVGLGLRDAGLPREDVFVCTKLAGGDHARVADAARESMDRLGVDYLDCYLIHWPAGQMADFEVWSALEELYAEKSLRAIGVSNYLVALLEQLLDRGDVPPAVNQVEMHPFTHPRDIVRLCHDQSVAVQAYSPLAQAGRLGDQRVGQVAERVGRSPAQVMLRWGIQHRAAVIPKSGDPERIAANAAVFDFELSEADMSTLDELG